MDKDRVLGENQSALSAENLAVLAAEMRLLTFYMKVVESADRFAASKVSLMIDSEALLTLVGEIIHRYSDCWNLLLIKHHVKGHGQTRCVSHVS